MSPLSVSPLGVTPPSVVRPLPGASGSAPAPRPVPDETRRAAQQFEAILMRQLLTPAIEPMMNGSALGGSAGGSGAGGGVYSYLLTDVLATSMSQGGGLGLARVLQKQLTPAAGVPSAAPHP